GSDSPAVDAKVITNDGEVHLVVEVDPTRRPSPAMASAMAAAWAHAGAKRSRPLRVTVERRATKRVAARVTVEGFGWAAFDPRSLQEPAAAVSGGSGWLDNGLVRIEVDPLTGTFSLNGLPGCDRLVDGGDEGDTYNYSRPANDDVVDSPDAVAIDVIEG